MRQRSLRKERLVPSYKELKFLVERGYPKEGAIRFVGDHHQLRQEERDVLYRVVFPERVCKERRSRVVACKDLAGRPLVIDGYNVLITLESALRSRPLVLGDDGFVRDISRVFRSFRPTERTRDAWMLVQGVLGRYKPGDVTVVLDAPMSRSGELAGRIRYWMGKGGVRGRVSLEKIPEAAMIQIPGVKASADSVVLDRAGEVIDLAGIIIRRRLKVKPLALCSL